jgi:hypothetical protein
MTTNTASGLPYPDPTDALADVDLAIKALAEAILGPLVTSGATASSGWTVGNVRLLKIGTRFAWLDLIATRTGATLTAAASGNIADTDVLVVPAAFRPVRRQYLSAARSSLGAWQVFVESAASGGSLVVCAGPPGATIASGDSLQAQGLVELL